MNHPDLLLPDAGSLLLLIELGQLALLPLIGRQLVLVDLVRMDLMRRSPKLADPVLGWLKAQGTRVRVDATPSGEMLRRLWTYEPEYWPSDSGLTAIAEWLANAALEADIELLVLTDTPRLHEVAGLRGPNADINVIGIGGLLELAEARGLVPSAATILGGHMLRRRRTSRRRC
ncbi:hypothetical protein HN018_22570 (plasmid) [Lichenicola cladoniae]|uniref:Uncharacterized protein n=1 Tax=Lichenicola cladoniae TaxID=1484109 RepID=A0A6M8HWN3_9PROT|nr:hypothetical protein [Lichenicola cladoniae]NPD68995.1 hypothetical protein [Acetobacteraceae bacterium]QKE92994.1 hypothetical protein HN018_22570 [Lichenicola cladoniae]